MGCADPPSISKGVSAPHQWPLEVGSKLPLPLYADVRFHIPMTHTHGRPFALLAMGPCRSTVTCLSPRWSKKVLSDAMVIIGTPGTYSNIDVYSIVHIVSIIKLFCYVTLFIFY